ncbi:MAG: hypothetical protein WBL44_11455 [Nitrososphaeraceae archaeon]|jgi:hypothetical protein
MIVGAIAVTLIVSNNGLLQEVYTTAFGDHAKDRANSNLDKHIAADGEHGAAAQKIKDKLNHGRLGGS